MGKDQEAIAIGIGPQASQALVDINAFVRDAVDLITGPASASGATGILLRSPEDLSKAFERIESDGGRVPGSLTRASGTFTRVEPTVSFVIDVMGNRFSPATPASGEFNFDEYFEQILSGARLVRGTEGANDTSYDFVAVPGTTTFKTLKIWRGLGNTESWTLVGCTFNLTFNSVAEEKSTVTVDVIADSVIYNSSDTFPPADVVDAFGNQRLAAPICELALSTLDSVERGFQTSSLAITYNVVDVKDSNVTGGLIKSQGTRSIDFEAAYFRDTASDDFTFLEDNLDGTGPAQLPAFFTIGQAAGAGDTINAVKFDIRSLRVTATDKIDGEQVLRTIRGYATISGDSGVGIAANEEFSLSAV